MLDIKEKGIIIKRTFQSYVCLIIIQGRCIWMTQEEFNTRDRIIDTAKTLFAEKGFYGVSVRDITGSAGVNTSMISYYFGGKDGLYETIFEREFISMLGFLNDREYLAKMAPREKIIYLVDRIVEMHSRHPELACPPQEGFRI